jgi:hypothetical protein
MDPNIYIFTTIVLFILRIIITIYCINKATVLERNRTAWGLLGFLLPIVAIVWIQFIKPKNLSKNSEVVPAKSISEINHDTIRGLKKSLNGLKEKQLINETEYLEKNKLLNSQEQEILNIGKSQQLERLIADRTKPTLIELEKLLNSGILNLAEFNEKKSKLVEATYNYYKSFPHLNPDCHLQMEVFKKSLLPARLKKQINEALPTFKSFQIVIYNKFTEKLERISLENLYQIDNSENRKSYLYIDIFE